MKSVAPASRAASRISLRSLDVTMTMGIASIAGRDRASFRKSTPLIRSII